MYLWVDMREKILFILLFNSLLAFSQNNYSIANNYYRQGEYKKAIQYYEKLVQQNPFNSFYIKRIISCYQELNEFEKSAGYIQDALAVNPAQTYWYVEMGFNFQRQQKDSLANAYYDRALESICKQPGIGGTTGRFFRENNLLDRAVKAYELAMQLNQNSNYSFQLARIYGEQGDFDKMFNAYIDLIDRSENYVGTVRRYTSSYLTDDPMNKYNIAFKRALLRKSVSKPKNVWNGLLSWLFTKQGEFNKAFVQEKAIFKRDPENLENIEILAQIAYENKAYEVSKKVYQFVLNNSLLLEDKLNAELFLLQIDVALQSENVEAEFEAKLKQYGYNSNTIFIQKVYANYLTFVKNQPERSRKILEKALGLAKSKFEKARIKLALGDVLVYLGNFNKALIYFSQIQTQLKNHPLAQQARYKVAETSFFKADFTWAKAQLKVLKGSTSQLIANDAVDLFLIVSDNEPQDSLATGLKDFAKARLLAYQNKNQQAIKVLQKVEKDFQGQNIEDETLLELAKLYLKTNQFESAIASLERIVAIDKAGTYADDAYFLLAETYRNHVKDLEKASEYYQKIIFEQASSIYLVEARKKFRQLRGDAVN